MTHTDLKPARSEGPRQHPLGGALKFLIYADVYNAIPMTF